MYSLLEFDKASNEFSQDLSFICLFVIFKLD